MKFILTVLALAFAATVDAKIQVCYWFAEIGASAIDPFICTHIYYSFLGLDANGGLNHLHRSNTEAENFIIQMVHLKNINPNLKVLAAIGGYNEPLVPIWSAMAANPTTRSNFARNIYNFVVTHGLDGIDLDWEYPNFSGNEQHDVQNFNLVLREIRAQLGSRYLLTVAIGAGDWRTNLSYDIPAVFDVCDFVNLMSYDLHGGWESVTGIHAALYPGPQDQSTGNVDHSVNLLLGKGINRNKLIMGIPAYGNAFNLANPSNNGVGAPASGAGSLKYFEICQRINAGSLTYRWEEAQRVPYAFSGSFWVGYDDIRSVIEKGNYINNHDLGGSMWWALDTDDHSNSCGNGRYPLISTVYNIIVGGGVVAPPVTDAPPVTNPPGGGQFTCPGIGLFRDPNDCASYYNCYDGIAHRNTCTPPLLFHQSGHCDWPDNVTC